MRGLCRCGSWQSDECTGFRPGDRRSVELMTSSVRMLGVLFLLALAAARPVEGQITGARMDVVPTAALDGVQFGSAGSFERLRGSFHGSVDPSDPRNAVIALIELAPRSAEGNVEYSVDVELLRPTDMLRWNGSLLMSVPRGGMVDPPDPALLELGFAVVSVAWQGTLGHDSERLSASFPPAYHPDGTPVSGTSREEFIFDDLEAVSRARLSYPAASPAHDAATLTVRRFQYSSPATPDDLAWAYDGDSAIVIQRPAGFDAGAIYEFIYEARDPIVLGLGFAATRDVLAFLRHALADADGHPNPLGGSGVRGVDGSPAAHALAIGTGQGGRFLRDLVHFGFNEDLEGRPVFDGIHPHGAGAGRTFTNAPFGQPQRHPRQHEDQRFPGFDFPFTYAVTEDPVRGASDGILARCTASGTCPKVIHSDGEGEYWEAGASLVVTDVGGRHLEQPDNVRVYAIAGAAPVADAPLSARTCTYPSNPFDGSSIRRALTVALHEWVTQNTAPPESRYPSAAERQLILPAATAFANIDGVEYSAMHAPLARLDHSTQPPSPEERYTVLVPRIDGDANMLDGIRHPLQRIADGTFTGWNIRAEGFAGGELCSGAGGYFPFAETRDDREGSFDRRQSFRERYPNVEAYVQALGWITEELVTEGFLLPDDAASLLEQAPARFR